MRGNPWRTVAATVIALAILTGAGGLAFIYYGAYDIAASSPHWPLTDWVIGTVRDRSIAARARGIPVPPRLDDPDQLLMGTDHFAAHCAVCHGAPGVPKGDIAQGLYPAPPDLKEAAGHYTPAELFWVLKHGIKLTGMPAWSDHSDEELWATVAFLEKLPTMSEADYAKLIMANMTRGGMHRHGEK